MPILHGKPPKLTVRNQFDVGEVTAAGDLDSRARRASSALSM